MQQATFEIQGMSCGHCVAAVKEALAAVPGVKVENVSIGRATVSYEPGTINPTDLTDAIQDAGYDATAVA